MQTRLSQGSQHLTWFTLTTRPAHQPGQVLRNSEHSQLDFWDTSARIPERRPHFYFRSPDFPSRLVAATTALPISVNALGGRVRVR
jgi:hypothetical protein